MQVTSTFIVPFINLIEMGAISQQVSPFFAIKLESIKYSENPESNNPLNSPEVNSKQRGTSSKRKSGDAVAFRNRIGSLVDSMQSALRKGGPLVLFLELLDC